MTYKRAIVIVLDGVGIGQLPDNNDPADEGSNTLVNTAKAVGGLNLPNMGKMGLGNIDNIQGVKPVSTPIASFGKMDEKSPDKDTTTGHWELMGLILDKPFVTFPNGFPPEIIEPFKKAVNRNILANYPASGTEIIKNLGEEHQKTGALIVYTSADSVFQIAAHEETIPLKELYRICKIAFAIVKNHNIGRVIARPFLGTPGNYYRTPNRKDYSLPPFSNTLLDNLIEKGFKTYGIGKIEDIFAGYGISYAIHTKSNIHGIEETLKAISFAMDFALIFTNLVDFDMKYGHRNDPRGMATALEEFDKALEFIQKEMKDDDLLIITADHGCDPTTPGTDHSGEYVPLIVYSKNIKPQNLDTRETFADVAASIWQALGLDNYNLNGRSFI